MGITADRMRSCGWREQMGEEQEQEHDFPPDYEVASIVL